MGCLELNAALACSTVTEPIRQESRRLAGDFAPSCACRTTVLARILITQRPNRPSLAALAGLARCKPWSWRGGVGEADDDPRGGQNRSPSPSPHGRTRMIVFPLIRSVGLKAATASSRAATLPMFVRTRPSRARRTISVSWARSVTTTKSTVRPSDGSRLRRAGVRRPR